MSRFWKIMIVIVVILTICLIGWFYSNDIEEEKNWYDDLDYYTATRLFLKNKANNPSTFEFVDYPNAKFGTEQDRIIEVTGRFKCANAYGVYSVYSYYIKFEVRGDWYIKNYLIA